MKKSYKKANLAIPLIIIGVVGVLLFSSPAISEDIPITLWSIHNAISNVNMTNHNITNIQELCDGQECYTLEELNYSILSYNISNLNNLTNPKLVGFAVKNSTTAISATTWTVVSFSSEIDDNDNAFSSSTYTVPAGQGGIYSISGMFTFASVTDGNRYIVGVEVNGGGSPNVTFLLGRGVNGATQLAGVGGSVRWALSAGDTIRMVVYCDNATSGYNQNGYQTFSAYRIGA